MKRATRNNQPEEYGTPKVYGQTDADNTPAKPTPQRRRPRRYRQPKEKPYNQVIHQRRLTTSPGVTNQAERTQLRGRTKATQYHASRPNRLPSRPDNYIPFQKDSLTTELIATDREPSPGYRRASTQRRRLACPTPCLNATPSPLTAIRARTAGSKQTRRLRQLTRPLPHRRHQHDRRHATTPASHAAFQAGTTRQVSDSVGLVHCHHAELSAVPPDSPNKPCLPSYGPMTKLGANQDAIRFTTALPDLIMGRTFGSEALTPHLAHPGIRVHHSTRHPGSGCTARGILPNLATIPDSLRCMARGLHSQANRMAPC